MFHKKNYTKIISLIILLLSVSILVFVILDYKNTKDQKGGSIWHKYKILITVGISVGVLLILYGLYHASENNISSSSSLNISQPLTNPKWT